MDLGDSVEKGEQRPLLDESYISRHREDGILSEVHQRPQLKKKSSIWNAPTIILGMVCLESMAFGGISMNIVVYIRSVLHGSNASSAANTATWSGTGFFTPLIGALLADIYFGNYNTILISLLIYLLGMITITISALCPSLKPPPCEGIACQPATWAQYFVFFSGLYFIAFGSGGIKAALLPFGADQFDDKNPDEREKKGSIFSWYMVCGNFGVLLSSTIIVWIQENVAWALGFGIATLSLVLASVAFLLGTPTYRMRMPSGSPFKSAVQVLVAAFRKMSLEVPTDSTLLYEVHSKNSNNLGLQRFGHTDGFRFLDKAATITDSDPKENDPHSSWKLCTVSQVEELKIFLQLIPIWATNIIFATAHSQMHNTFIQQGRGMNTRIGSFSIPPATLASFEMVSVMALVFLYNSIIAPASRKCFGNGRGPSELQRLGAGRFLMILAMATAAFVEVMRLQSVKTGEPISIGWQLPQYFIVAGSEVLCYIPLLEFFYGEAPESMKSMCTALAMLSISLGYYLNSLIVTLVVSVTTAGGSPGWIPDDLNKGHLDYYFLLLTGLSILNLAVYVVFAQRYKSKKVIFES